MEQYWREAMKRTQHYSDASPSRMIRTILMKGKQSEKGLDRTLTEACSNDDLIIEPEFTEALSGLSKDTAACPDKVKYSDIKNLSVDDKSEIFRLYEESFSTGQVLENWSHNYLKAVPKPGKDHSKLNTTGKLMERLVARKLAQDLEMRNVLLQTLGGSDQAKPLGKTQPDSHTMSTINSRGRNKLWP